VVLSGVVQHHTKQTNYFGVMTRTDRNIDILPWNLCFNISRLLVGGVIKICLA
jgi:hypothetical protein